jgi:hypothetical protein
MEEVRVNATKDQINELKESILWLDIVNELIMWKQGFNDEMMTIVDDSRDLNSSTAAVLLHMGDLNGRQKAVDYLLSLPDVFLQILEDKKQLTDKEPKMTVKEEIDSMLNSLNDVNEPESEVKEVSDGSRDVDKSETGSDEGREAGETGGSTSASATSSVVDVLPGDRPEPISSEVQKETETRSEEVGEVAGHTGRSAELVDISGDVVAPKPDGRDQIIADLQARLNAKEAKREEPKIEDQDFLGEVDLDELTRDPKEFNKVLNKIYQKAVMDTRSSVVETLPEIVKTNIAIMNELKSTSDKFYEDNKDLQPFRKVVSVVFDEIAAASPTKNYSDLIKEVAPEVRKRLNITKKVEVKEVKKSDPPKLPQKGSKSGKSQDSPNIEPLQAELEEMTKTLRR